MYQHQVLGTIISSVLDYDNLCKITGDPIVIDLKNQTYVPCDGRSIDGSLLASKTHVVYAPDLRGRFQRGLNTIYSVGEPPLDIHKADEDGLNRVVGDYQADSFKNHIHGQNSPTSGGNGSFTFPDGIGWTSGGQRGWGCSTSAAGEDETRPRNCAVYFYLKIN